MAELEARMGSSEYEDWKAYWAEEPWGALRDNLHSGELTAMLYNIHRKQGTKAATARDFLFKSVKESSRDSLNKGVSWLRLVSSKKDKQ